VLRRGERASSSDSGSFRSSLGARRLRYGARAASRLSSVDKSQRAGRLRPSRDIVSCIGNHYPGIVLEHLVVDKCAMAPMQNTTHFDTVVMTNTSADILSDAPAILAVVQNTTHFDTIVLENTFGNVLSDVVAILAGAYNDVVQLIDEVGEPTATLLRHKLEDQCAEETGRCPRCGERRVQHR
jgi:Isocitrate/isopropylmalate dehydrogenase